MPAYTHEKLLKTAFVDPEFWLDPYIPKKSITFLWADKSVGKSPLTWQIARSVASGKTFFGLPVKQGRVLYLEVDTAAIVNVPRIRKAGITNEGWESNLMWVFDETFQMETEASRARLMELQDEHKPDLVIFNTLRKMHGMDDKDSRAPQQVYTWAQRIFPQASHLFVHHERKRSTDPNAKRQDDESFSGSKAWTNDATVALHLQRFRSPKTAANLRLVHHRSQASEQIRHLELTLSEDGTNLGCHYFDQYLHVYERMNEDAGTTERRKFDAALATELGVSTIVARRRRLDIENGLWPHTRSWLGKAHKGKKGDTDDGHHE